MRITFVIRNVYGVGGTIKTTVDSANALAERGHEVSVISLLRHRFRPQFRLSRNIAVKALWDIRSPWKGGEILSAADKALAATPSVAHVGGVDAMKLSESCGLLDERLTARLREHDADVVVGTHVGINLIMARVEDCASVYVGQEHLFYEQYPAPVKAAMRDHYPALDGHTTLTERDAEDFRRAMPEIADRVWAVPNSVPANEHPRQEEQPPFVMAAGRMARVKRFDDLLRAFALIAGRFPEWRLRLYGKGLRLPELEALAAELGIGDRVDFMGPVSPLDAEWAKASVAVSSSLHESFGLTLLEAMAAGTPLVATKVAHGPEEFIEDGRNGLLARPKDPASLADALARAMEDPALRKRLAENGREFARRFEPEAVLDRHARVFTELLERRRRL
ncbi:glycosyltransferase family 4 protein [Salininema proteolyticum]|uniref:Glycosyltransferase family 4 protein n=1 Tax=Salininema proteolyticum TaxID=1607685 RepID=A0ABV8U3M2_9ACTN